MCIRLWVRLPFCLLRAVCVLQVKNWLVRNATSGSHLVCHLPSHFPNGALQAMRLALSLKSHTVTPISFEIIAVFLATWSLLSNYHRNFPGRMWDIWKSVPPDCSSKMTEQPPAKKTVWRAVVAIATEQPLFVSHSSGKETMVFLFPHILSSIVVGVFFHFLVLPPWTTACWAARSHVQRSSRWSLRMRSGEERSEEPPVTYCSRNPGAL